MLRCILFITLNKVFWWLLKRPPSFWCRKQLRRYLSGIKHLHNCFQPVSENTKFQKKFVTFTFLEVHTWIDNKVRELIAVKVLHSSLLNTTVVAFKVLPLGSYAPISAPSPPFKTILELVLWNGFQSCPCTTPDVINAIKLPSFQYFLYFLEQKKIIGG